MLERTVVEHSLLGERRWNSLLTQGEVGLLVTSADGELVVESYRPCEYRVLWVMALILRVEYSWPRAEDESRQTRRMIVPECAT